MHLSTIVLKDGYDGQVYRIDAVRPETAQAWLYETVAALRSRPSSAVYCPLTIETFAVRSEH